MTHTLTTIDFPDNLQANVKRICIRENINLEQIRFTQLNPEYYQMNEAINAPDGATVQSKKRLTKLVLLLSFIGCTKVGKIVQPF